MWDYQPANVDEWHRDLVSTAKALAGTAVAMVVVDPLSGEVFAATDAAASLLGLKIPSPVTDLVRRGVVARPDLRHIANQLSDQRRRAEVNERDHETTYVWSTSLVAHTAAGGIELQIDLVHHRRPPISAEAVLATVRVADAEESDSAKPGVSERYWMVFDQRVRVVAADPRLESVGLDPKGLVGMLGAIITHPKDLPEVLPLAIGVLREQVAVATYISRLRGPHGWVRVQIELRRLFSADGPMLVAAIQHRPVARRAIPMDLLSPREGAVVAALFDGLRVSTIAARDGVAVKTVRNQLAAAYAKLGVGGQEEVIATFTRPPG